MKTIELLEMLPIGEPVHVATSQYSIDPIGDSWKPITKASHQILRSMVKRGLIKADFYWRGATVTRIK